MILHTICMGPKYIFDELLAFSGRRRISLPRYSTVQNPVSDALNFERKRTIYILSKRICPATAQKASVLKQDWIQLHREENFFYPEQI